MNKVLEISSRKSKGGRRKIEIVLHKIHEEQSETNINGIHWSEENTRRNIESVSGIPICAEFTDDTKEVPLGHGYTSTERIDGKDTPLFENSEVVGTIDHGEIKILEVNGETIKALVGVGYVYDQRYPKFVSWIKENLALSKVDTSIEIMGLDENQNKITYVEEEPTENYRTPKDYDYSGVAILSIKPADSDAIVLECAQAKNQDKEEKLNMTEKEIVDAVQKAIVETNSVKDDLNAKITELNSSIEAKDAEIKELNEKLDAEKANNTKTVEDKESEINELTQKVSELEADLAKAKISEKLGELNSALDEFSDTEKEIAKDDIEKLTSEINSAEKKEDLEKVTSGINSIKSKICMNIVEVQKKAEADAKVAEQNSANKNETIDIFSEMNSDNTDDDSDTNIF